MAAAGANKRLACGHVFHLPCLRSWLERQDTCPTCRAAMLPPQPRPAQAAAQAGAQAGAQPGAEGGQGGEGARFTQPELMIACSRGIWLYDTSAMGLPGGGEQFGWPVCATLSCFTKCLPSAPA